MRCVLFTSGFLILIMSPCSQISAIYLMSTTSAVTIIKMNEYHENKSQVMINAIRLSSSTFLLLFALWHVEVDAVKDRSLTGLSPGILSLLFSSIPLFILSSLSLEALWTPSRLILFIPHVRGQCVPHKNKPTTSMWGSLCMSSSPYSLCLLLSHLLVPYRPELAPFTALPSPLERTSQGPNSAILCLIAPAPLHGEQSRQSICEDTEGNELALCLVLTYRHWSRGEVCGASI